MTVDTQLKIALKGIYLGDGINSLKTMKSKFGVLNFIRRHSRKGQFKIATFDELSLTSL